MKPKLTVEQAQQVVDDFVSGLTSEQIALNLAVNVHVVRDILGCKTFPKLLRPTNLKDLLWDRRAAAARASRAKVSEAEVQQMIYRFANGDSYGDLSSDYGLGAKYIRELMAGDRWPNLVRPPAVFERLKFNKVNSGFQTGWADEKHASYPELSDEQQEIIVGSLLGDGSISKKRKGENCCFVKTQCKKFKEYVYWHYDALEPYSGNVYKSYSKKKITNTKGGRILERKMGKKRHTGFSMRSCNHPIFSEMRAIWYVGKTKIVPKSISLTPRTVAVWYCDDGTNNYEDRRASIFTNGFTIEDAEFLANQLGKFGITPTILTKASPYDGRDQPYLSFTGKNYDGLIHLVKPYTIWDCFQYKVQYRESVPHKDRASKREQLTDDVLGEVIALRESGLTWNEISAKIGIRAQTIRRYLRRKLQCES